MLYTSAHFHHVLHDLFYRSIWNGHIDRSHSYHEVQSRDDIACVLDEFVKVCEVVDRVALLQVLGEISHGIEYCHVELIVLLWTQTRRSQFGYKCRAGELRQRSSASRMLKRHSHDRKKVHTR